VFLENILDPSEVIAIYCLAIRIGLKVNCEEGYGYNFPEFKFGTPENILTLSKYKHPL
jgi:hypothetical protein